MVRDTFLKSQASYLEFLGVAEQRASRVSPDAKLAWQKVFKLQRLLNERQTMRLMHLLRTRNLDCSLFETLDDVAARLDAGWSEAEEIAMKGFSAHYSEISREIGDIRSNWDPHAIDDSSRNLEQDPQYLAARSALADRAKKFAERIKR